MGGFAMKKLFLLFSIAVFAVSCNLLDQKPHIITGENFYNSVEEAEYGLNGIYGALNSLEIYGRYYSISFALNDDISYYQGVSFSPEDNLSHDASAPHIYEMWCKFYQGINSANLFLEAISTRTDLDPDSQMSAQARFLRAYYHFLVAQTWGDVPLVDKAVKNYKQTNVPATKQLDVLLWCEAEMKAAIDVFGSDLGTGPGRLNKDAMKGILARMYLFMAGKSVAGTDSQKLDYLAAADALCAELVNSGRHRLNDGSVPLTLYDGSTETLDGYSCFFARLVTNVYDTDFNESMWEADFYGDRNTKGYSNGYIGNYNGIRAAGASDNYEAYQCNMAYSSYCNTLLLWDMYMSEDRVTEEKGLAYVTDKRQEWNLPPYSYVGRSASTTPMLYPYGGDPGDVRELIGNLDKTPYTQGKESTNENPLAHPCGRYIGKFRREVKYEGPQGRQVVSAINFPILRYSDVLLMYAETRNELNGGPTSEAYNAIKQVRDRAGIATRPMSDYDYASFRKLVQNERGRELVQEAVRKYDLIRWGILYDRVRESGNTTGDSRWDSYQAGYMQRLAQTIQPKHAYLPIPTIELGVNPVLVQNPLW